MSIFFVQIRQCACSFRKPGFLSCLSDGDAFISLVWGIKMVKLIYKKNINKLLYSLTILLELLIKHIIIRQQKRTLQIKLRLCINGAI